jgi:hypothetical protein
MAGVGGAKRLARPQGTPSPALVGLAAVGIASRRPDALGGSGKWAEARQCMESFEAEPSPRTSAGGEGTIAKPMSW